MPIPDDRLHNFMRIYKEEFGEDITLDEAREMLTRLVTLYQALARPLPREAEQGKGREEGDIGDVPGDDMINPTPPTAGSESEAPLSGA